MAMLISKFHRLIQSKLLWAAFLVIVVFSFVIWGTSVPSSSDQAEASAPGTMHGEPVPAKVFRQAYFNTYLTVLMAVGRPINITPEIDAQLRKAAWQRLASLEKARELGIGASDDEVFAAIQSHEGFSTDGQFNKGAYKAFTGQFLAGMGFTERMFEEHVREEIVMQKLRIVLDRTTLVTPLELKRAFSSVSDRFTIDYVAMKPSLVEQEVKVTEEEERAFFDEAPAAFTVPEKVRVQYVRINDAPFIPTVKITEEETRAYYDENLNLFEDTNTLATASDTNLLFGSDRKIKPFEEVRQDIANQLIQRAAREKAEEKAMALVDKLSTSAEGEAMTFTAAAAEAGLSIQEAGPFALEEDLANLDAGPAFNRAAFELSEGDDLYFSNPVDGEEGVYVLALLERQPERVPAFDEVRAQVAPLAKEKAVVNALTRKASEVRETLIEAQRRGQSFSDALASFGLEPEPRISFSSSTGLETNQYANPLIRGVMVANRGEFTELIPAKDAILLAHVVERQTADPATFESLRDQLVMTIRRQYGRMVFDAWQEDLLKQAAFTERAQPTVSDEGDEVDPEAPEESEEG